MGTTDGTGNRKEISLLVSVIRSSIPMSSVGRTTRSFDMQLAMIRWLTNWETPLRATGRRRTEKLLIKSIKNPSIIILIRISALNQDSISSTFFGVKQLGRFSFSSPYLDDWEIFLIPNVFFFLTFRSFISRSLIPTTIRRRSRSRLTRSTFRRTHREATKSGWFPPPTPTSAPTRCWRTQWFPIGRTTSSR